MPHLREKWKNGIMPAVPLTTADVFALRAEFPYFANPPMNEGVPVAYLDSAATSQRPRRVLDAERLSLIHI